MELMVCIFHFIIATISDVQSLYCCSIGAHNIKTGWFRYVYNGYPRDKKSAFSSKGFLKIIGSFLILC